MEEVKRIDTKNLYKHQNLTDIQQANSLLNIHESMESLGKLESLPRRIVLELTNACNLNCVMCGRNHTNFNHTFFEPSWLEHLKPFMNSAEEITFMGWGEPTLHPSFYKFLEFASSYPVKKYLLTNGVNLDIISPMLLQYGIDILAVSLDGPDSETNNIIRQGSDFNQIIKSLRLFVIRRMFAHTKPHINTVTTLMKSNIRQFPKMIDLASDLGIDEVKGVYLTAFSKELEEETLYDDPALIKECFEDAVERANKLNILISLPHIPGEDPAGDSPHKECHLAWRDLFVGSDGYIRSCMSSSIKFENIINGCDDIINKIWNGHGLVDFRKTVNGEEKKMNPVCRNCYQSSCANWNMEHSFIQTDKIFSPDWS
jgi:MoaA/NifB/PqqE/SkfB family radical SAM enzyme